MRGVFKEVFSPSSCAEYTLMVFFKWRAEPAFL
jgi:hypothetical protein